MPPPDSRPPQDHRLDHERRSLSASHHSLQHPYPPPSASPPRSDRGVILPPPAQPWTLQHPPPHHRPASHHDQKPSVDSMHHAYHVHRPPPPQVETHRQHEQYYALASPQSAPGSAVDQRTPSFPPPPHDHQQQHYPPPRYSDSAPHEQQQQQHHHPNGVMQQSPYSQAQPPPPPPGPPPPPPQYGPVPQQPPHTPTNTSYDGAVQYGAIGQNASQMRRKAVRAAQACESCRSKKAKCDEARPACSNCISNNVPCIYRDMPPPKQDRTIIQLTDRVNANTAAMEDVGQIVRETIENLRRELHAELALIRGTAHRVQSPMGSLSAKDSHDSPRHGHFRSYGGDMKPKLEEAQHLLPTALQSAPFKHPTLDNKQLSDDVDSLRGKLSIPPDHTTAAHKLLVEWGDALRPFYTGVTYTDYVMLGEWDRGLLSLYDCREKYEKKASNGVTMAAPGHSSPTMYSESGDTSTERSFTDSPHTAPWVNLSGGDGYDNQKPSPGGIYPDGSLCLDGRTCSRLLKSYIDHIHIMHPFLNRKHLTKTIEDFVTQYTSSSTPTRSSFSAGPNSGVSDYRGAMKRKRSDGGYSYADREPIQTSTKKSLDRTIDTALILLVFAIGRICEDEGPLPASIEEIDKVSAMSAQYPNRFPASPPNQNMYKSESQPGQLAESPYIPSQGKPMSMRNLDVIPGLAYYAYAAQILGELHGGNDLRHVQARLLAGLYMGQLARVFESWKWINDACTSWQVLNRRYHDLEPGPDKDAIQIAYWSCLQLESDILAELDMPHSGVSRLEDTIPWPKGDPDDEQVMLFFTAQILLRKILNRIHSALYSSVNTKHQRGLAIMTARELAGQLESWRKSLPESLQWNDAYFQSSNINAARLRAKYYGGLFIAYRPFLQSVVADLRTVAPVDESTAASVSSSPSTMTPSGNSHPDAPQHRSGDGDVGARARTKELAHASETMKYCNYCVEAAKRSTAVFDKVPGWPKRLIITNIFGTAHAQFGNMLVLAATWRCKQTSHLIPLEALNPLLHRTMRWLTVLSSISPTMQTNLKILEKAQSMIIEDSGAMHISHSAPASFTA